MGIQQRGTQGTRGIRPLVVGHLEIGMRPLVVGHLEIVILVQQETEMETEMVLVLNDYIGIPSPRRGLNVW